MHYCLHGLSAAAEIQEGLQVLAEELQEQLPSISTSVRIGMFPVSLAVAGGTLYTMYRINRSRL